MTVIKFKLRFSDGEVHALPQRHHRGPSYAVEDVMNELVLKTNNLKKL